MIETRDRALLERRLREAGVTWAGYALADLDDAMFDRTRWFVSDVGLLLVYRWGRDGATAMMFGHGADLLPGAGLPRRFDLHVRDAEWPTVSSMIAGDLPAYWRLGLSREDLRAAPPVEGLRLDVLGAGDVALARELYAAYPGNVFDPARVGVGLYLGAWSGARLVGVGGTHVASSRLRVAAIGALVPAPDWRGRGVAKALTHALCARHLERVDHVVLNVERSNAAAVAAYERVGFGARPETRVAYREGQGVRFAGGAA